MVVAITTSDAGIRDRFDQLLGALPNAGETNKEDRVADIWIGLVQSGSDSSGALVELWVDGKRELPPWTDEGVCEDHVIGWIDSWALDSEPERIHLHAGLVSRDGAGILLVGPKGAGKSTLVAHLVRSGWRYHSDEMVGFDPNDALVAHALARPPSLKPGSWPFFADLPTLQTRRNRPRFQGRIQVPPAELGEVARSASCEVRAIVFLSRGKPGALTPVAASEAIERCVADTMDLGRAGIAGMSAIVRLVTGTHRFSLGTCELARASALIETVAKLDPVEAGPFAWELQPVRQGAADQLASGLDDVPAVIRPGTKVWRAPRTATWPLVDGAVVYDPARETVTCLNPSAADIWIRLDGRSPDDLAGQLAGEDPVATQAILAVLQQLYDERLVEA